METGTYILTLGFNEHCTEGVHISAHTFTNWPLKDVENTALNNFERECVESVAIWQALPGNKVERIHYVSKSIGANL